MNNIAKYVLYYYKLNILNNYNMIYFYLHKQNPRAWMLKQQRRPKNREQIWTNSFLFFVPLTVQMTVNCLTVEEVIMTVDDLWCFAVKSGPFLYWSVSVT